MVIYMNKENFRDVLIDRVKFWTQDEATLYLYNKMYKTQIEQGVFDNKKIDVKIIVDNDYVNNVSILELGVDINPCQLDKIEKALATNEFINLNELDIKDVFGFRLEGVAYGVIDGATIIRRRPIDFK